MSTPAGWYQQEDGRQRYWDGAQWTEHFAPRATGGDAARGDEAASPQGLNGKFEFVVTGVKCRIDKVGSNGFDTKGRVYFDVPKKTKLVTIELHDSMLSGGVEVALKK